MPSQFADYTSFLEVAFAINLLFGGWQGFARLLLERRRLSFNRYAMKARVEAVDDAVQRLLEEISARNEACRRVCRGVERWGRVVGFAMAAVIVAALFLVGNGEVVDGPMLAGIVVVALPVPLTMALMVLVQAGCRARNWRSYRRFRADARYARALEYVLAANNMLDARAGQQSAARTLRSMARSSWAYGVGVGLLLAVGAVVLALAALYLYLG